MDLLCKIIQAKRDRLQVVKRQISLAELKDRAQALRESSPSHALAGAITAGGGLRIIAEYKRRSPSKGVIRDEIAPLEMSALYESGGAAAISVLTEQDFFGGSLDDLAAVARTVSLPILRKDFIFDQYQVFESAAAGAEALLLIVSALSDESLVELRGLTEELGMDALVEVHTSDEMKRAVDCGATLIGVNNRDLKTFAVSLDTSVRLAEESPDDAILISESGLNSHEDLKRLRDVGYAGFLIGEVLMTAERPAAKLQELIGTSIP